MASRRPMLLLAFVWLGAAPPGCGPHSATLVPPDRFADSGGAAEPPLSSFVPDRDPSAVAEPSSEQRPPVALGPSPAARRLDGATATHPTLPRALRDLGESQLRSLAARLSLPPSEELEVWPIRDDHGRLTWAAARRRAGPGERWTWLESDHPGDEGEAGAPPFAYLPWTLDPARPDGHARIFDDFLRYDDLYEKRVFGECVWTDREGTRVFEAWMPSGDAEVEAAEAATGPERVCRVVPQPAELDGRPVTFVVDVAADGVVWPADIEWTEPAAAPAVADVSPIVDWPADVAEAFRADLAVLSGEEEAVFPRSGRRVRFERKSCAQPDNQLLDVVAWLEERYAALGVAMRRVEFTWRGIPQADLIAVLPGAGQAAAERPVLIADHIDTAFAEDVFARTGARVSVPGADDNATATATLLLAARVLADVPRERDVWLVHLTGEEFPGDDLGARHLVGTLFEAGQHVTAILQMDMIGWRAPEPPLLQVSAGEGTESLAIGVRAVAVAGRVAPDVPVALRTAEDPRSYLYNTDGLTFEEAGFPVVLFNEHVNGLEFIDRPGYHESGDVLAAVDVELAAGIARVVIETAAQLAAGVEP
jgi:hypothetical protein